MNAPGISPYAATSNTCASSSVATTAPISTRIVERVPVEREARRPHDDPPEDRVGDARPARPRPRTFWSAMTSAHSAPSSGHDRIACDEPAGDDVRRADRRAGRSPRRCRCASGPRAGPGTSASGRGRSGRAPHSRDADPVRGRRVARPPRTRAGGAPSRARRTGRRPRTAGTRAGRTGPRRRPGTSVRRLRGARRQVVAARRPRGARGRRDRRASPARGRGWAPGPSNDSMRALRRAGHVDDQRAAANADEAPRQDGERRDARVRRRAWPRRCPGTS